MGKEVAKTGGNAVANATMFDDVEDLGYGHESASDFVIPRIAIIGDLSPQIKKNKEEYIEGCEVGDIVDVAMGSILAKQGEAFEFLPVSRVKEVIEWKPRSSGGGIASRNLLTEDMNVYAQSVGARLNEEKFEYIMPKNGNELIETHQIYGINLSDGRWCFIPMKKSNLKIARKWFTRARSIKLPNGNDAPLFFQTYHYSTFLDNGNGNEWYNWKISEGTKLQEHENGTELFAEAMKLQEAVTSGEKVADMSGEEPVTVEEGAM